MNDFSAVVYMSALRQGDGGDSLVRNGNVDRATPDLTSDEASYLVHGRLFASP